MGNLLSTQHSLETVQFFGSQRCILPYRSTINSSGFDLFLPVDVTIPPNSMKSINLEVGVILPRSTVGLIKARSSAALDGIIPLGGVIDPDFRRHLTLIVYNASSTPLHYEKHDSIAQLLVVPVLNYPSIFIGRNHTDNEHNGFGSTGHCN